MVLVAVLTVRRSQLDTFRTYERHAARVMAMHGGFVERTVVVDDGTGDNFREIHVVTFPDAAHWAAYRVDPSLTARAAERERAVVSTEVLAGVDGPTYP